MEETLNIKYTKERRKDGTYIYRNRSKYVFVRYADDFDVLCKTRKDAENVYSLLKPYLEERRLTLAPDKTKITHIRKGFDFLGFNIREYKTTRGIKVYTKPSKDSIRNFKRKASDIIRRAYGGDLVTLIESLNYLIRGTANYWRIGVSSRIFSQMDHYIWFKLDKLLRRLYPKKSRKWIKNKHYLPDFRKKSKDKYIFTDLENKMQVIKMVWTHIKRHNCIKYKCTPYNIKDKEYFAQRYAKPAV